MCFWPTGQNEHKFTGADLIVGNGACGMDLTKAGYLMKGKGFS